MEFSIKSIKFEADGPHKSANIGHSQIELEPVLSKQDIKADLTPIIRGYASVWVTEAQARKMKLGQKFTLTTR